MSTDLNDNISNQSVAQQDEVVEIDLKEVFYTLWTHIVQIIGFFITGAVIAFIITFFLITPKYTATTTMYVVSGSSSIVDLSALQIGTQIKADYRELIKSRTILEDVIDSLNLEDEFTTDSLADAINVSNTSDTRILSISVETTNAQLSADIANELAQQATTYLPRVMKTDAPTIVDEAIVPESKSSPSTTKNVAIGGLLAAFAYCAFLIIRMITNDTFVTPEDISRKFGVQPLASIPEGKKKRTKKGGKK